MKNKNIIKVNGIELEYIKINNDINGNPRYLFHFLDLITDSQKREIEEQYIKYKEENKSINYSWNIDSEYNTALNNSRLIGGKKYKGKDFSGGIVISSYSLQNDLEYMFNNIK